MNKNTIILAFIAICTSCVSQRPSGLYCCDKNGSCICINQDSISIFYEQSPNGLMQYYYGTFINKNDTIVLDDNLLKSNNAVIELSNTDYNGTEIQLYELFESFNLGAPTDKYTIYYDLSKGFDIFWNYNADCSSQLMWKKANAKANDGLIQIPLDTIMKIDSTTHVKTLIRGYSFYTEQMLLFKPYLRYTIKQKSRSQVPLVPQEMFIIYNKYFNQIDIITCEVFNSNSRCYRTKLSYARDCPSCLEELRKRYPEL